MGRVPFYSSGRGSRIAYLGRFRKRNRDDFSLLSLGCGGGFFRTSLGELVDLEVGWIGIKIVESRIPQ